MNCKVSKEHLDLENFFSIFKCAFVNSSTDFGNSISSCDAVDFNDLVLFDLFFAAVVEVVGILLVVLVFFDFNDVSANFFKFSVADIAACTAANFFF